MSQGELITHTAIELKLLSNAVQCTRVFDTLKKIINILQSHVLYYMHHITFSNKSYMGKKNE